MKTISKISQERYFQIKKLSLEFIINKTTLEEIMNEIQYFTKDEQTIILQTIQYPNDIHIVEIIKNNNIKNINDHKIPVGIVLGKQIEYNQSYMSKYTADEEMILLINKANRVREEQKLTKKTTSDEYKNNESTLNNSKMETIIFTTDKNSIDFFIDNKHIRIQKK